MTSATDTLRDILRQEQAHNYSDHTVDGGLSAYIADWNERALAETPNSEASSWIQEIAETLAGYTYVGQADRESAISQAFDLLAGQPETASEPSARHLDKHEGQAANGRATARRHMSDREQPARSPQQTKNDQVTLTSPLTCVKGVGATYQERLARLGLHTVKDLLFHLPRRYMAITTINRLELDQEAVVLGRVDEVATERSRSGIAIVRVKITDTTGSVEARWWGQAYLARRFHRDQQIAVSGKINQHLGRLVFSNPEWEPWRKGQMSGNRLVPVYPLTKGVTGRRLRGLIEKTIDYWAPKIVDPLPTEMIESADLMPLSTALREIHFPVDDASLAKARERLCFDEFLLLQLGLLEHRRRWRALNGRPIRIPRDVLASFLDGLPFALTGAQRRALDSILDDLGRPSPMRRLLQGDVGSGKTVVALAAALATIHNGLQVAVMAPTGILAEQHHQTMTAMLTSHPEVRCALLTGSLPAPEKARITDQAARGEIDLLIGTHALIQDTVSLPDLGLVIVDEQHRFGVVQRATLAERSEKEPHLLAMSATPIPRTLAMTLYGDLDISVLDELPPGRQEIVTAVRGEASRERLYGFIETQIEHGRQAFIVCPLIASSEQIDAHAATEEYQRLPTEVFPHLRLGLLHGSLTSDEKDAVMASFKAGEIDVLVTTTVIEVGIDVPNASVMMIEDADRFGLAQLHQLRGRIGRGEFRSYCILLSSDPSDTGLERLQAMEQTSDGFVLAEKDLQMRGPGDFFGVRQAGLPLLKVASLSDTDVLELARREARSLFDQDPDLSQPEHANLSASVKGFWSGTSMNA